MGKTTDMPSILNPSIAFASHSQLLLHTVLMLMAFEDDEGFICRIYITAQRDSFLRISQLVRKSEYTDILLTFPLRLLLFEAPLLARKHDTGFFFFSFLRSAVRHLRIYFYLLVQWDASSRSRSKAALIYDLSALYLRYCKMSKHVSIFFTLTSVCLLLSYEHEGWDWDTHGSLSRSHSMLLHWPLCDWTGSFVCICAFGHLGMHVKRSGKVCSISALHPPPVFNWDILSLTYFSNNPCGTINFFFFRAFINGCRFRPRGRVCLVA